ncbi:hypothetical protein ABIC83_002898 [Roseateles asaccharophilus]|uniref:hypothetical protein n=1 Tax=Roseateles asaccharophilus TaxID=582607 RepID=UPI0038350646
MSGWRGIKVRNADGRTGKITSDYEGFLHRALSIEVDGGGSDYIQLNSDAKDSGSLAWEWWCAEFDGPSGPGAWLVLGDHNPPREAPSSAV